jgi:hypothetical protein
LAKWIRRATGVAIMAGLAVGVGLLLTDSDQRLSSNQTHLERLSAGFPMSLPRYLDDAESFEVASWEGREYPESGPLKAFSYVVQIDGPDSLDVLDFQVEGSTKSARRAFEVALREERESPVRPMTLVEEGGQPQLGECLVSRDHPARARCYGLSGLAVVRSTVEGASNTNELIRTARTLLREGIEIWKDVVRGTRSES